MSRQVVCALTAPEGILLTTLACLPGLLLLLWIMRVEQRTISHKPTAGCGAA